MSFKRATVVMLPTKEKANLWLSPKGKLIYDIGYSICEDPTPENQHLYFITKDEIKRGDYWLYINPPHWRTPQDYTITKNVLTDWFERLWDKDNYKKVIASTDPSLVLPQPSEGFIQKFIEKWNKDDKITEVDVEYELKSTVTFSPSCPDRDRGYVDVLKVNSKDSTITIKSLKNSWTREEVIELIKKFGRDFGLYVDTVQNKEINEWIKENL